MAKVYRYKSLFNSDRIPTMVADKSVTYKVDNRRQFDTPHDMRELAIALDLDKATEEHCYCACLNSKLNLIGFFEVSHGTINEAIIDNRVIFQKALLLGAAFIMFVHNHPSGDVTPSQADIEATKRIAKAGHILGVPLIEHLIIGDNEYDYYSFNEWMPYIFEEKEG